MFKTIYSTEGTRWIIKNEVERLALLGFLERVNNSEWGSLSFEQPKPKTNCVCILIGNIKNKNS